jgi:hypothetical protein
VAGSIFMSGCEAFIHARGTIYDYENKQPLQGVSVIMIWRNRDTMYNCAFELDTLDDKSRRKVRRSGVKDEYTYFDFGTSKRGKPVPLYSDVKGKFATGTYWTSAAFGIPRVRLFFTLPGYEPLLADRYPYQDFYLKKQK